MKKTDTKKPQVSFPPSSQRPVFCCYDEPFRVETRHYKAGVYFHCKDDSETLADLWVCSALRAIAITPARHRKNNG